VCRLSPRILLAEPRREASRESSEEVLNVFPNSLLFLRTTAHSSRRRATRSWHLPLPRLPAKDRQCLRSTGQLLCSVKVFGTATEYIRVGDQGAKFIFRFCPVCGTTVFHTEDGHNESVGVAVGAFADPNFPAPRVSVYDSRRHPWVQLPPGTRTFDKDPS
jgi:hypothetical protein